MSGNGGTDSEGSASGQGAAVDFITRFTASEQFERVFRDGMSLVEETANYLDGPGRLDARQLDRAGSIAYATESMRLTTRLMQLASWLLLQRAVKAGEITATAARSDRHRIKLTEDTAEPAVDPEARAGLPQGLLDLAARSERLHERISAFDRMLDETAAGPQPQDNPVTRQFDRLAQAFGTRGERT